MPDHASSPASKSAIPNWQIILVFASGLFLILILLAVAIFLKNIEHRNFQIIWVILSLASAAYAALIPGFLEVKYKRTIQAGGAIAVFVIVYMINPGASAGIPWDPDKEKIKAQIERLWEDTSSFVARAQAGGQEKEFSSPEAVSFYAVSYNLLDQLAIRTAEVRADRPCSTGADLKALAERPPRLTELPFDYLELDCAETTIYLLRFALDQLNQAHETGGVLAATEASIFGSLLKAQQEVAFRIYLGAV
jgi:hypothetical protein